MVRQWIRLALAAFLATGGWSGCLLDAGAINKRPHVQLDEHGPLHRGERVTFTATITDANDKLEALTVAWRAGTTCDEARNSQPLACESDDKKVCNTTLSTQKREWLCVVVQVTDPDSANEETNATYPVENLAPQADIALIEPSISQARYDLHTGFILSGEASKDPEGDTLNFIWTVTVDGAESAACKDTKTKRCSFTAAIPGTYEVTLRVEDSYQEAATITKSLVVAPDGPPCIKINSSGANTSYSPQLLAPSLSASDRNIFAINSITDDVNPYPARSGTVPGVFSWSLRSGTSGDFTRISEYNSNQLPVDANYFHAGDVVQFRVEYQDTGVSRVTCDPNVLCCSTAHECCPPKGDNCGCAQWITWTVTFQ